MNSLYLAYGSNLHPIRLQQRVPAAAFQGRVRLPGYRLQFNKRGMDGSGKCNIQFTGEPLDQVLAAVYSLSAQDVPVLDQFEGAGYEKQPFALEGAGEAAWTFAYVAPARHCDDRLMPFDWYQLLVLWGARFHGFPSGYLERMRQVAAVKDEDAERRALNRGLLERMMTSFAGPESGADLQGFFGSACALVASRG
jgi:hypothetical protein